MIITGIEEIQEPNHIEQDNIKWEEKFEIARQSKNGKDHFNYNVTKKGHYEYRNKPGVNLTLRTGRAHIGKSGNSRFDGSD